MLAVWGRRAQAVLVAVGLLIGWAVSEVAKAVVGRAATASGRRPHRDAQLGKHALGSRSDHAGLPRPARLRGVPVAPGSGRPGVGGPCGRHGDRRAHRSVAGLPGCPLAVRRAGRVGPGWRLAVGLPGRHLEVPAPCSSVRREDSRLFAPRPPARKAVRVAAVVFVVILCVAAYILTAHSTRCSPICDIEMRGGRRVRRADADDEEEGATMNRKTMITGGRGRRSPSGRRYSWPGAVSPRDPRRSW